MSAIPVSSPTSERWQSGFVSVLPEVQSRVGINFRYLGDEAKEEATQEAVASAFVAFRSLTRRGRLGSSTAGTLSSFAVKHVRSGRHVGGSQERARDVMSTAARRRQRVTVMSYNRPEGDASPWPVSLIADRKASVPDLAAFRIDFKEWVGRMGERDRNVIAQLAEGEKTHVVAERFGLSPGRVSQLRRRYERDWQVFQGEALSSTG
jgi:hypothetical protein